MEDAVIIEPTRTGFSAYVPDVPGCIAAGDSEAEVTALIREALEFHFEELRLDGEPIPQLASRLDHGESTLPSDSAEVTDRYAVIETGPTSFGAWVPDLPGCVAVADTAARVRSSFARESLSTWKA
jgi:predicted RNase H-like HicB family nuclease